MTDPPRPPPPDQDWLETGPRSRPAPPRRASGGVPGPAGQPDDIALLHGQWNDGNTSTENRRGEWIPAIPLPYYLLARYRCGCGRKFWTLPGYQGHYALDHILALEPWVRSETRRFWRAQWRARHD